MHAKINSYMNGADGSHYFTTLANVETVLAHSAGTNASNRINSIIGT